MSADLKPSFGGASVTSILYTCGYSNMYVFLLTCYIILCVLSFIQVKNGIFPLAMERIKLKICLLLSCFFEQWIVLV